jgi:hypothetical protein
VRVRPLLLALSLGACPAEQPTDPLDPAVIAELAEAEGDAEGSGFDGQYIVSSAQRSCECERGADINPCATFTGLDGPVDVTHIGGYLTVVPIGGTFYFGLSGGVDRDGSFVLAAISDLGSLVSASSIYMRLDGSIEGVEFAGDLTYRLFGTLGDTALDCRATFAVTGFRSA